MRTCSKGCSYGEAGRGVIRQMDKEEKLSIWVKQRLFTGQALATQRIWLMQSRMAHVRAGLLQLMK